MHVCMERTNGGTTSNTSVHLCLQCFPLGPPAQVLEVIDKLPLGPPQLFQFLFYTGS